MLKLFKLILLVSLINCFYLLFYYFGDFILIKFTQVNISDKYKYFYPIKNQIIIGFYLNVFCLLLFLFFKFATISLFKKKFNSTMGFILSYLAIALFIGFSSFSYGVGSVHNFDINNWVVLFLTSLAAAFLFKKINLTNHSKG